MDTKVNNPADGRVKTVQDFVKTIQTSVTLRQLTHIYTKTSPSFRGGGFYISGCQSGVSVAGAGG
jgi:hypothetical protein